VDKPNIETTPQCKSLCSPRSPHFRSFSSDEPGARTTGRNLLNQNLSACRGHNQANTGIGKPEPEWLIGLERIQSPCMKTRKLRSVMALGLAMEIASIASAQELNRQATPVSPRFQSIPTSLSEVPLPVQDSIHREARAGPVDSIRTLIQAGQTRYEITFEQGNRLYAMETDASGKVLSLTPVLSTNAMTRPPAPPLAPNHFPTNQVAAPGRGRAPAFQSQTGGTTSSGPLALKNSNPVTFGQLPFPALRAIQAQAAAEPIVQLNQASVNGRTVYQAIYDLNGQYKQVEVDSDGTLIYASPTGPVR
jgi:hypothetical protein